ncbi:hypothetical protein ACFSTH_17605 [Paenibacillus yanchengensis]|uniref:Uncharacterized protein n=1 Tax=Paenibacillus yanchengensis TaxID=2035833 RepID=A0ABW4YQX5_9BACL
MRERTQILVCSFLLIIVIVVASFWGYSRMEAHIARSNAETADVMEVLTYAPTLGDGSNVDDADYPYEVVDADKFDVKIPLDLAEQSIMSSSGNEITTLIELKGLDNGTTSGVIAFYQLADGEHEVIVSQTINTLGDVRQAVHELYTYQGTVDSYQIKEYDKYIILIEDSVTRKQIHMITDDDIFTVASPGILDLELLQLVANKIVID